MKGPAALLLSHHPPSEYDRCFQVGGQYLCRRCVVLYPVAFAVAALSWLGWIWPERCDPALLWLLPLPATLELLLERFGALRHQPARQVALTLLAAPALGRGFARYLHDPGDRLFWGMVLLFGGTSALVLLLTRPRR